MNPTPLILPDDSGPSDDTRTLRDRQEAIGRKIDALANERGEFGVGRQLVQVYTDSTLPTCTPCTYLGRPTFIDGAEQESGSATVNADSTASIAFVLLNGSVNVGDVLPVFGVGGRWVAEVTGSSSSCNIRVCALYTGCDGTWPLANVSFVTSGGGGCVTDSSGCCTLHKPGTLTDSLAGCTVTGPPVSCGGSGGCVVDSLPAGYACCPAGGDAPACLIPPGLMATDANGTWPQVGYDGDGNPLFAYTLTKGNVFTVPGSCTGGGGSGTCGVFDSGTISVGYSLTCTEDGQVTITGSCSGFAVINSAFDSSGGLLVCEPGCDFLCASGTNSCNDGSTGDPVCGYTNSIGDSFNISVTVPRSCTPESGFSCSGTLPVSAPSCCSSLWPATGWNVAISS